MDLVQAWEVKEVKEKEWDSWYYSSATVVESMELEEQQIINLLSPHYHEFQGKINK